MWKLTRENLNLPEIKKKSGIYKFWCNNHFYIGSAKDFRKRLITHINTMKNGTHHNHTVQNVFNKYGLDSFYFSILEYCSIDKLLERETFYIKSLNPDMNHILDAVRIVKDKESIERSRQGQISYYKTHKPKNSKRVYQYTISGELIKEFITVTDATKELKLCASSICSCCNGKIKTAGGFRWSYIKSLTIGSIIKKHKIKPIYQLDINKNFIEVWYSFSDLSKKLHLTGTTIKKYLNKNELYRDCYWTTETPLDLNSKYKINPILQQPKFLPNLKASIKVFQYGLDGNFIREYVSAAEADRQMGASTIGAISSAIRENSPNRTAFGFQWRNYKTDKISPYVNNSAKAKIKEVFIFDIINNKYLNFESIAEATRNLTDNRSFASDCATMSSCCKSGTIFKNNYLCSYTKNFKLSTRKTTIYNTVQNKFYINAKVASENTNISEWKLKQMCIDQNNVEWVYAIDSARKKLRESGKLLMGQP